jgi:hypothetical protein
MKTLSAVVLAALLGLGILGGTFASPVEEGDGDEETQDTWCGFQCDKLRYNWMCFEPADRCCWESATGDVCGDSSACEDCPDVGQGDGGF